MLILRFLQLLNSLLELQESLIMVLLGLVLLLLEEVEFTLPESFLLIEFALEFSMVLFHLVVLALPVLHLLSNSQLTLRQGLIELLVLLLQPLIFNFIVLDKVFLLSFQVLVFLDLDSSFSLELRVRLLDVLFKLLECFSLLVILDLNAFLLLLNSCDSLLHCLGSFFLLLLEPLFIPLDRLGHLIVVLLDSLLLEGKSLVLQSLFSFGIDFILSELVHGLVVFDLDLLNLGDKSLLLVHDFVLDIIKRLFLVLH